MRKIFLLALMVFFVSNISAASLWTTDPSTCPATDATNFPGQDCSPTFICGDTSGIAQCYDTSSITAPVSSTNSNTNWASAINGGYVLNCYATSDATLPFCDNGGALWCDRNETCYSTKFRTTSCTAGVFGVSDCETTSCRSGYLDCNSDGDVCEIAVGASCGSGTGTYGSSCNGVLGNCTSSLNLDCNNDDSDSNPNTCNGADGCEVTIGGVCMVGELYGTYASTCSGSLGNCIVGKSNFVTGNYSEYSTNSTEDFLGGRDYGQGNLVNLTSGQNGTFVVDNSGNVSSSGWFSGFFNIILDNVMSWYFTFDGRTFAFNETRLNETILDLAGNGTPTPWGFTDTTLYNVTSNVGIGTANPGEKLEVVGNANISSNLSVGSDTLKLYEDSNGDVVFKISE